MKFLSKKSKVAQAPAAPTDDDTLDVNIEINEKTSVEDGNVEPVEAEVAEEAVSEEVSPEPAAEAEASEQTEPEEAAAEDAPTQEAFKETTSSVTGKLKFWGKSAKAEKKEEEPAEEESQEQEKEEPVEEKEEAAPAAEAEAAPAEEANAEAKIEAEAEATDKGEFCGTFSFLQHKFNFWQKKAAEEQKEGEDKEDEEEAQEAQEEKDFTQTVEVFVDGLAIQTIRLTNAGMESLSNFIASVQQEADNEGDEVSKTWLAEKLSMFFGTAMVEGNAQVEISAPAPVEEAPAPAPVEEETAEVETQPAAKSSWWPFSSAKTEEKAVDDGRNETAEAEADATEQTREVAEAV